MTCKSIPPDSVGNTPHLSVLKPPNFDPSRLAMPKANSQQHSAHYPFLQSGNIK
ncbi:hypothetical protein J40TS1_49810 [Paenibacillus montaniterrae]|uniref:Uncharacterized protein n=1 Tax=Paenibacillus montaniterrae TaxID=429341 RepID=A0A919YWF6_9BACL|nr:hypothetical protein J40TS1_49810 [Paenibacillus montaniterrae]